MLINENYKIESDDMNVTLLYRATGTKTWQAKGYFSSHTKALDHMVEREIMGEGTKDYKSVCQKIDELTRLINSLKLPCDPLESLTRPVADENHGNGRVMVAIIPKEVSDKSPKRGRVKV